MKTFVGLCKARPILLTSLLLAKKLSEACEAAAEAEVTASRERERVEHAEDRCVALKAAAKEVEHVCASEQSLCVRVSVC